MASRSLWNFNPRSHERSDHNAFRAEAVRRNFNPRSHERSDNDTCYTLRIVTYFNPRSHERSDSLFGVVSDFLGISIHAPTRGATPIPMGGFCFIFISIHAPTRGATRMFPNYQQQYFISIHAPTRGATRHYHISFMYSSQFQSTLPREERQYAPALGCLGVSISIHAPTRGATICQAWLESCLRFQSTLPREERQKAIYQIYQINNISIHAPTRGATSGSVQHKTDLLISIHAPTRGATIVLFSFCWSCIFQSTLPREERQSMLNMYLNLKSISIHAPTRGATVIN